MRPFIGKVVVFLVSFLLVITLLNFSAINAESKPKTWYTIDGNGYPHITWSERITDGNAEIIYIKWDGENWKNVDGEIWDKTKNNAAISNNDGFSGQPSVALDSNDHPHIAWMDYSYKYDDERTISDIFYIKWNGKSWVNHKGELWDGEIGNANISDTEYSSYDPKLVLDKHDNPHIAWSDYSFCVAETTDGLVYETAEIIYLELDESEWKTIDGENWNSISGNGIVSDNIGDSYEPDFVLNSEGHPYLVWSDTSYHLSNMDNFFIISMQKQKLCLCFGMVQGG